MAERILLADDEPALLRSVTYALAREGFDVDTVEDGQAALDAARDELTGETDRPILAVRADTTSDEAVRSMVDRVVAELGRVDVLVNAAAKPGGQAPPPALADITEELFLDDMQT